MVTIREQSHKYAERSEAVSPPEAARLTFHLAELSVSALLPTRRQTCTLEREGRGREKDKECQARA